MVERLRRFALINPPTPQFDQLTDSAEVPFLPLEAIWPGAGLNTSRRRPKSEVSTGYTRFLEGDILVPKITPTFQADRTVIATGIDGGVGVATTEVHVVRVNGNADRRYVRYLFSTKPFLSEGEAAMTGVAGQQRVPDELLRNLGVPVTDVGTQRAIAEFLERETARIDALVAAKRRMILLTEERESVQFVHALEVRGFNFPQSLTPNWHEVILPTHWRVIRLSQCLVELTNGYVGPTRDILRDAGIRYIQSLHIKYGKIDFDRRPFFVDESWHRARPRIHLRSGDVLIVQTGDIGQVAVVPAGFGEASCHALQIARVHRDMLSGEYLGAYLRSPFGYQSLLSRATGALHPHLEGSIRDVPVIVPPLSVQQEVLSELREISSRLQALRAELKEQIDLLAERRQALITDAVSGKLGVDRIDAA